MDNETFTDADLVCSFLNSVKGYTALVGDCKNRIIIYNKKWATGQNPGLGNLTGNAWYEHEDDGLLMINAEINFEIDENMCIGFLQVSQATFMLYSINNACNYTQLKINSKSLSRVIGSLFMI